MMKVMKKNKEETIKPWYKNQNHFIMQGIKIKEENEKEKKQEKAKKVILDLRGREIMLDIDEAHAIPAQLIVNHPSRELEDHHMEYVVKC